MIETMISDRNYMVITILNFFKLSITYICLIVCTDIITIYEILIYYIKVFIR